MTQLQNWITDETAGKSFVYLTAPERWLFDARDRARRTNIKNLESGERVRLEAANLAVTLYLQGRVELVQRRISKPRDLPVFEYIAIRRKRRGERDECETAAWCNWQRTIATPPKGMKKRPTPRLDCAVSAEALVEA